MGRFGKSKPIEKMSDKEIEKTASKSIKKQEWETAEIYLRALIDRKPSYGGAYTELATCLLRMGREDEALEFIEAAVKAAPEDISVLATSGILLGGTGRNYQKAVEYIETAQALGLKDRNVDSVLKEFKHYGWAFLEPTTGDHILTINKTFDRSTLKPIDKERLKAHGFDNLETGQVALDITPQLDFIAEIAHEAIENEKQVSMRDLCQKCGIAGYNNSKDVVRMAGKLHGFKVEFLHLLTEDLLATFSPLE